MLGFALLLVNASAYLCKFRLPDNHIIDLSPLKEFGQDYELQGTDGYHYYANICGDAAHSCKSGANGVAAKWEGDLSRCISTLGRANMFDGAGLGPEASYIDEGKPEVGVKLTYYNGDMCNGIEAISEFWIYCDVLESGLMYDAGEESPCAYRFEFTSKYACKRPPHRAVVFYWIFGLFAMSLCLCLYVCWDESDGCCQDIFSKVGTKVGQAERVVSKRGGYETV
mmetsp:Transcript_3273/g.6747  ORF Transcript_3273/g.6747 Transcript_3273/m.6747 type:complete len:225 (-) Transcript_3273:31-705(-)